MIVVSEEAHLYGTRAVYLFDATKTARKTLIVRSLHHSNRGDLILARQHCGRPSVSNQHFIFPYILRLLESRAGNKVREEDC